MNDFLALAALVALTATGTGLLLASVLHLIVTAPPTSAGHEVKKSMTPSPTPTRLPTAELIAPPRPAPGAVDADDPTGLDLPEIWGRGSFPASDPPANW